MRWLLALWRDWWAGPFVGLQPVEAPLDPRAPASDPLRGPREFTFQRRQ